MKNLSLPIAGLFCTTLAACSLPQASPQETNYLLSVTRNSSPVAQHYASLRLIPIRAAAPYDTAHFVYRETEQRYVVDPYRGYLTPPPQQIGTRLRDWLAASGLAAHIVGAGSLPAQARIDGELTRLDIDLRPAQPHTVTMALHLRLQSESDIAEAPLLIDRTFSASVPLTTVTADNIAAAADQALGQIFKDFETALTQIR